MPLVVKHTGIPVKSLLIYRVYFDAFNEATSEDGFVLEIDRLVQPERER